MARMNVGGWNYVNGAIMGVGGQRGNLSVGNIQIPNGFLTTSSVYDNKCCLTFWEGRGQEV